MASGMSRDQAARWVARTIPKDLASQLSSKGFITVRTVRKYLELYDCGTHLLKLFEHPREREAFARIFRHPLSEDDDAGHEARLKYIREHTPPKKLEMLLRRGIDPSGIIGFINQMYLEAVDRAEVHDSST
jgi:hypothetical protein